MPPPRELLLAVGGIVGWVKIDGDAVHLLLAPQALLLRED
jgi:hypothetical protein